MAQELTNPMALTGKCVLVTGAGQGIGRAIAAAVVGLGGDVVAIDRNGETLEELVREQGSGRVTAAVGDVTDESFIEGVVEAAFRAHGRIDGLVNNAGITRPAMIHKMDRAAWDSVIAVNLTAPFLLLQAVGRKMLGQAAGGATGGSIVNISSDAGRRGTFGQINYGAAKSGVNGLTMSAAREWANRGVRVNSVAFGVIETPMTEAVRGDKLREQYLAQIPMGRWGTPAEVANTVCFLLSDAASYITGQVISVNGGYHISA